jgi:4-hydroxy-3-methylbut-2-enyl diphosphate reductase
MQIRLARNSGFCFGVKRAIKIAKETARAQNGVYIKGDLVHNEGVCKQIEALGIKKINSLTKLKSGETIIIKAHGEPLKTYEILRKKKVNIVDATCPMVRDIHKKAAELKAQNYTIVIVGDRHHEETIGIIGNINAGLVLQNKNEVAKFSHRLGPKIAVLCQSTQNIENVGSILAQLAKYSEELIFINTICRPTRMRQAEIEDLSEECEAILIVGSKKSANTKRLYEAAKKKNKNTFWITSNKIDRKRFLGYRSVGIIGGASTPVEILESIAKELKRVAPLECN